MPTRQEVFERTIEDYDTKQLPLVLDFAEHRFVSIERDSITASTFVQGHKSLRGACSHLSRVVEECQRFIPEKVLDLDTGDIHELDVFAFVAPKSVDAVAVMMPRPVAEAAISSVKERIPARPADKALGAARQLLSDALSA